MAGQVFLRTSLHSSHVALKARMLPFAGWQMPVWYTGILGEVHAVRSHIGLFDVSHMGRLRIQGEHATALLEWTCTNNVDTLPLGQARYTLLCNAMGGIIDDVVYYRLDKESYLLVCNASNRSIVSSWLASWIKERFPKTTLEDITENTVMLAFQGPKTASRIAILATDAASELRSFAHMTTTILGHTCLISRTGYTGEDGFELIVDSRAGLSLWTKLTEFGTQPSGLGARDLLRLEAGLMLHGNEIDLTTSPLEAGLDRFVQMEKKHSIATASLAAQRQQGLSRRLIGFVGTKSGIPRTSCRILSETEHIGYVTSGTFSPTLDRSIGMGYVSVEHANPGTEIKIDLRGRIVDAQVCKLPFYKRKRQQ